MKSFRAASVFACAILGLALFFAATAPAALPAVPENHPQIHDALAALRNAKSHLQSAKHDFGGHRADALRATDDAIHQLEICLKYDK